MIRLFKVSIPNSAVALILSETLLVFCCYLFAAKLTLDVPLVVFLFDQGGYWYIGFETAVIILGLFFSNLYESYRVRSRIRLIQQFCLVLGMAFLLQSLLAYAQSGIPLPKWVMVYGSGMVLVILPLWRITFTALVWRSSGGQKLLFLGSSPAMREIAERLMEKPELGMTPIGYLDSAPHREMATELSSEPPRLGSWRDLDTVISHRQPARIIISTSRPQDLPVERLLELRLAGLQIEEASTIYEALFGRIATSDLPPAQVIFSSAIRPRTTNVAFQTAYSVLLAVITLIVALPVMAIVALVVRSKSGGPVFLRERCAGLNGSVFTVLKFRTAGVGNWLRELRLDKLPQLFNVLRGEMSIVGPRPERVEFVSVLEEQIPYYRQRLSVKPGITGWAQINEHGSDTIEDSIQKLEFDRYYIKNLSIWLDAYILFHTMKTTLLGR